MALKNLISSAQPVIFSDFDFTFKPHPKTGDIQVLKNEESLKRALKTLVQTTFGSRRFYSDKGCNAYSRLFEPLDFITASSIKTDIKNAINNYDSRINLSTVQVIEDEENNGYIINIYFSMINKTQTEQVTVFLKRVR